MKSTAAILSVCTTVTLLTHYSAAESGDPTVESRLNTRHAGIGTIKPESASAEKATDIRYNFTTVYRFYKNDSKQNLLLSSLTTDILQTILQCSDPLTTYGCRECEKSCANPNPTPLCVYRCDSTCICKPGLYRTFIPSPTCAPLNGPLLNNCKVGISKVKG
ncbi:uncharacterized protein LOC129593040 isoform X1 [Paramacrobiotus metropolitanus]|uniref:uncharacterized protein LOC129593040 isoform X1 n=1 Tax=Paramacrobiotus metropolitanus TaxID=2943436 RepID=UPI0024457A55|nr:uncharacterized protein LOC129593040 isoform X1 [Paramacrobiotus metropolitanus]